MKNHTYSFLVLISAFGHLMIPSARERAPLSGSGVAIKQKLKQFLLTVAVHPFNSSSVD